MPFEHKTRSQSNITISNLAPWKQNVIHKLKYEMKQDEVNKNNSKKWR